MIILGIDTSSRINAIGLVDDDRIMADFAWEARENSLQKIILNIDLVLRSNRLALDDIDGLATGIGPGSWTGVRIGVTVGKILAYAARKPICGIASLDALAYQARYVPHLLCPLVEAGQENVYAAFYRSEKSNVVKVSDYYVDDIKKLLERVEEHTVFLGSALQQYWRIIAETLGPLASYRSEGVIPKGSTLALLALTRFERGESDEALSLAPLYLKEAAAQAILARKSQISKKEV